MGDRERKFSSSLEHYRRQARHSVWGEDVKNNLSQRPFEILQPLRVATEIGRVNTDMSPTDVHPGDPVAVPFGRRGNYTIGDRHDSRSGSIFPVPRMPFSTLDEEHLEGNQARKLTWNTSGLLTGLSKLGSRKRLASGSDKDSHPVAFSNPWEKPPPRVKIAEYDKRRWSRMGHKVLID